MAKIRIFVYSQCVSSLDFVDKEGAQHACARAGSSAFSGLKHYPGAMDNRYLSEEEKQAITLIEEICKKNQLDFEIVDLGKSGFLAKTKAFVKGIRKFPTITFMEEKIDKVPTEEKLRALVSKSSENI
ncbi:MAG: hypothetical protein ACE5IF_04840 [Candidatus Bathyarchaeia archaeon]